MKHTRITVARIDGAERDKDGFLRCDARLTKTGVFEYQAQDGKKIREARTDAEVFAADSLESYLGAAVTRRHPRSFVTPDNHRLLSVGTVLSVEVDPPYVRGKLKITDAKTADEIEAGKWVEISMGYRADIVPGDGVHYDALQQGILINHAALLQANEGRLGSDVSIMRLDSHNNVITYESSDMLTTEDRTDDGSAEIVDAAPVVVDAPEADATADTVEADVTDAADATADDAGEPAADEVIEDAADDDKTEDAAPEITIADLSTKIDEVLARLDAQKAPLQSPKADAADVDIDAIVAERVARTLKIRAAHSKLCPGMRQDSKTDAELCTEALDAVGVDAEGKDAATLEAMVDTAAATAAKATPVKDAGPSFAERLYGKTISADDKPGTFADRLLASVK